MHGRETPLWHELLVALVAGTLAAALIWIAGAPEVSWVGYVAVSAGYSSRAVGRACLSRRGTRV